MKFTKAFLPILGFSLICQVSQVHAESNNEWVQGGRLSLGFSTDRLEYLGVPELVRRNDLLKSILNRMEHRRELAQILNQSLAGMGVQNAVSDEVSFRSINLNRCIPENIVPTNVFRNVPLRIQVSGCDETEVRFGSEWTGVASFVQIKRVICTSVQELNLYNQDGARLNCLMDIEIPQEVDLFGQVVPVLPKTKTIHFSRTQMNGVSTLIAGVRNFEYEADVSLNEGSIEDLVMTLGGRSEEILEVIAQRHSTTTAVSSDFRLRDYSVRSGTPAWNREVATFQKLVVSTNTQNRIVFDTISCFKSGDDFNCYINYDIERISNQRIYVKIPGRWGRPVVEISN